jgi:transcriptional regulator with XRE-family HTH domain
MDFIGKKIRDALDACNMSSSALGKQIGLTKGTIENVIFGRSRKATHLIQIEKALQIELTESLGLTQGNLKAAEEIDVDMLLFSFSLVSRMLKDNNVYVAKNTVSTLSNLLYDFYISSNTHTETTLEAYTKGMVDLGIQSHILTKKK